MACFAGCGDDPEPQAGSVGTECKADANECKDGLECTPRAAGGNVCTYAAGGTCKPDDDKLVNGGCSESAECVVEEGTTGSKCMLIEGAECDPENDHCTNGQSCTELESGEHRCYAEVILSGEVTDTGDGAAVEGAHVIAVDEEGVAVTDVAVTDAMGNYDLEVPVVRTEDGAPVSTTFTLRAAAQDYQPFPSGVRVALPIDVSEATLGDGGYVVENALTEIGLIPLEDAERSSITGTVVALDGDLAGEVGGVLVVAAAPDGAYSGISDKAGAFTIFNVPAGDYDLTGYAADIQIETEEVTVASTPLEGVELLQLDQATTTVHGNVQIVDAGGSGGVTSVILVVESTFDPDAARGEAPRGLRSPRTGEPDVTGAFTITGVPAGRYLVLAAYENDGLVRDPDTNIAGTDFVTLEVAGESELTIAEAFKVTAALETVNPGVDGPEAVDSEPELVWGDDTSEDWYDVRVFDAFGDEVWSSLNLTGVSGSDTVSVQYEGPLEPGMYYQFRVSSWRQPGMGDAAPISMTEDLRGVFFLPAP